MAAWSEKQNNQRQMLPLRWSAPGPQGTYLLSIVHPHVGPGSLHGSHVRLWPQQNVLARALFLVRLLNGPIRIRARFLRGFDGARLAFWVAGIGLKENLR